MALRVLLALGLLALARGGCLFAERLVAERFAQDVIADLRSRMFAHLERLSRGTACWSW